MLTENFYSCLFIRSHKPDLQCILLIFDKKYQLVIVTHRVHILEAQFDPEISLVELQPDVIHNAIRPVVATMVSVENKNPLCAVSAGINSITAEVTKQCQCNKNAMQHRRRRVSGPRWPVKLSFCLNQITHQLKCSRQPYGI